MNPNSMILRLVSAITLFACIFSNQSCMTTYDANGYPVQSVDPALAVAGIAAAGAIGYAAANNHNHNDYRYYPRGGYYRGRNYYRGGGYHRHYR